MECHQTRKTAAAPPSAFDLDGCVAPGMLPYKQDCASKINVFFQFLVITM